MSDSKAEAFTIASILAEHKGEDVVVLDVRETAGWTDYFVLGTCTSGTHMKGLERYVEEYASAEKIHMLNRPTVGDDEKWLLLDLGNVVVHIMNREARQFYELEKLWFKAPAFRVEAAQ